MTPNDREEPTASASRPIGRRAFLGVAAAGSLVGRLDGPSAAETIELAARTDGWVGRSPESIADEMNPILELTPDTEYELVWENVDGVPHNFVVGNGDGDQLVRSDIIEGEGTTQSVEFTATAEMSTYYCEVHPTSMRGDVTGGEDEPELPGEQQAIPIGPTVRLEEAASGLTSPVGLEPAPGSSDLQVVLDQVGVLYRFEDGLAEEPFLDIRDRMVAVGEGTWADYDERGLLDVAFHPDFAENRRFYVRYSAPPDEDNPAGDYGHTAVIGEFEATDDARRARPDSERVVFEEPMPGPVHNGGGMAFGSDGYLYFALADGSNTNDTGTEHAEDWYDGNPGGNGQNVTANRLGGIHRIDVDERSADRAYGIPEDNPLVGESGFDEYYAWGFRNPWRLSFDDDGRLFVSDTGDRRYEEVNLVENGGNYGWNVKEGTHCYDAEEPLESPGECPASTPPDVRGGEPLLDPVIEYPHFDREGVPVGIAGVGGYFYESGTVDALAGSYVFGDFSRVYERADGSVFMATPPEDDGMWSLQKLEFENREGGRLGRFVFSLGRDRDGALYVMSNETGGPRGETGTLHRIVEATGDGTGDGDGNATGDDGGADGGGDGDESDDAGGSADVSGGDFDRELLALVAASGLAGAGAYALYRNEAGKGE